VAQQAMPLQVDASLVRAVQGGSRDAFSELFRRHYPSVRQACARRLGDPLEADDVAQAAFVRALERIEQCDGPRRFGAWVHVIARRLCVDCQRARARTSLEESPVPVELPSAGGPDDPLESLLGRERAQHVRAALSTLSERQRVAVLARAVDGRPPGEIAASLGVSVSAVDSLLMRSRRRLASAYVRVAGGSPSSP
jgi:RNA polymerase sigma-70 factor (ECF subfamily)